MTTSSQNDSLFSMLGKVPSGIYILTARHGALETGMLASWVMQAGFEPPMLTVAVNRRRYLSTWLAEGIPFALNVVSDCGKSLLSHFGRGFEPDEAAFEGLAIVRGQDDVPLLQEGVIGHLFCRVCGHMDSGDHRIFTAEVVAGELLSKESPLVHIRKNGLNY